MLDHSHPGFHDAEYRARRDFIAESAKLYKFPNPVPHVNYTSHEHETWQKINTILSPVHMRYACDLYLKMRDVSSLDRHYIPQLDSINSRLARSTGFHLTPVDGLVSTRTFLSSLAEGRMLCTQYIRHHSSPLYTPEPDVVHELIGHAVMFFDSEYCRLNIDIGEAARVLSDESLVLLERLYWYSIEFGLVIERGVTRAFGAGLLSSAGELDLINKVKHEKFRPKDVVCMPYDTTQTQKTLFKSSSIEEMYSEIREYIQLLRRKENV